MYRDLLIHVEGNPTGRGRVRFAVDLAERLGARLSGLHVTPPADISPLYKPSVVSRVAAQVTKDLASEAQAAAEVFSEETGRLSIRAIWSQSSGNVVEGVIHKARYADLVILGRDERQGSAEKHPFPIAHSVVMQCGRPVLVVPDEVQASTLANIALAWDGSCEAVRAVHDALPLLRMARSVQIVTMVRRESLDSDLDAKRIVAHLASHEIKAAKEVLRARTSTEHKSLKKQIEQGRYDLLVMGAYSHSVWLEFVFGGATSSMLFTSQIPVLVSH